MKIQNTGSAYPISVARKASHALSISVALSIVPLVAGVESGYTGCNDSEFGYQQCLLNLNDFKKHFGREPLSDTEVQGVYGCLHPSDQSNYIPHISITELPECREIPLGPIDN
jgi:hypothetical protein